MQTQQRILKWVTRLNWALLLIASAIGGIAGNFDFTMGIVAGGLITTINFHLMSRTLEKTLSASRLLFTKSMLVRHYLRFVSGVGIIFILVYKNYVDPGGLLIGLSIVVASIMIATLGEVKKIICKEAT